MTIQEQINTLKKEFEEKMKVMTTEFNANIAELEKQAKAEEQKQKQRRVFIPGVDEQYWYLTSRGYDSDECDYDDGIINDFTEEASIRGNVFKTEEEAEWADQHRIVETELKNFVAENDPHPITEEDWGNVKIEKYLCFYNNTDKQIDVTHFTYIKWANQIYASNESVLRKAIEHIGEERMKKDYFGIGV